MGTLPSEIDAVVFDCDGLLLDTETCWSRAEASLFADYGFDFGAAEKDVLIGRTVDAACAGMAEYIGQPGIGAQLQAELIPRVEAELAAGAAPMPGAVALLKALCGRIPLGVATNSTRAMLDRALDAAGLVKFFDVTVTADEVDNAKPYPDLYLRAFDLLGAAPKFGVTLEDSSTGVAAARAADTFVITVPSQPGKDLDGDYLTDSLADPALIHWASTLSRR